MTDVDQNWAWFVLLGAVLANLLSGGTLYTFGVIYMDCKDRLDSSSAVTSAIGALSIACFYFMGPISRLMTSYLGYRLTTIIGSSVQALGLLLSVVAPNVNFYFLTLGVLSGCGAGLIYLACFAAISDYFDKKLNLAIGLVFCSPTFGIITFAIITRLALNTYSYYGTFILLSAIVLNGIVCGCLFFPLRKKRGCAYKQDNQPVKTKNDNNHDDQSEPITDASFASVDDDPATNTEEGENKRRVKVKKYRKKEVEIVQTFTFSADETHLRMPAVEVPEEVEEYESEEEIEPEQDIANAPNNETPDIKNTEKPASKGVEPDQQPRHRRGCWSGGDDIKAAGLLSCTGIGATFGAILSWFLSCKIDKSYTGTLLMLIGAVVSGLVISFIRFYSALFVIFFCAIGFGFFSAACIPSKIKIVTILLSESNLPGMASWGSWALGLGAILGPPIAGYLRDAYGTYDWSFVLAGTALCACALLTFPLLFVGRVRHRYIRDAI